MNDTLIPKRWLPVVRVAWVLLVLLLVAIFFAGIPPRIDELRQVCAGQDCQIWALHPVDAQALSDLGLSLDFYAWYQVGFGIFGFIILVLPAGLIFWRKSDSWMGVLLSLLLVYFGTFYESSAALKAQYPGLGWPLLLLDGFFSVLFVLLFFLFPDGWFVPRWTRLVVIFLVVAIILDQLFPIGVPRTPSVSLALEIFWLGCLVVGGYAQVFRYRRVSTSVQRQQTKWIMFGLVLSVILTLTWTLLVEVFPIQPGPERLAYQLSSGIQLVLFSILPISVVFSILRYRLWDIDIVIRRTLVYGSLTLLLALLYFGIVTLLQNLLSAVSGQRSAVSIVISTLAIAALFSPLRRLVQDLIDRRFFRRKYDSEQVMARFAATVREEIDLDRLAQALLKTVDETTQPEFVTLWLKRAE